jgi:hypothetical protein
VGFCITGLIGEKLDDLVARCSKIEYDQSRIVPAKGFSTDDLEAGKAHLLQIQTSFLPSLRQQLADLMASLDPGALEKDPIPKSNHTLEIIQKIGHILNQISGSVNSFVSMPPDEAKKDQDYGVLKEFRCHALVGKINGLIGGELRRLFFHYSVFISHWDFSDDHLTFSDDESDRVKLKKKSLEKTALSSQVIDSIIEWSSRSDFDILQDTWVPQVNSLSSDLEMVTRRINSTVHPKEERDTIMGSPPGSTYASWAPENNQGDDRDGRSEAGFSSDHEEDQSRNTPEIPLTPLYIVELIQQTIPIIKLSRIFFNKIISTPKGKPPFTFHSRISSADIACLQEEMAQISVCVTDIVELLCNGNTQSLGRDTEQVSRCIQELSGHFDSALIMLGFHLIYKTPQPDLPQHENLFKTGFYSLRSHFRVALNNLHVFLHVY